VCAPSPVPLPSEGERVAFRAGEGNRDFTPLPQLRRCEFNSRFVCAGGSAGRFCLNACGGNPATNPPAPAALTTQQDHQRMLKLLGLPPSGAGAMA